MSEDMELDLLKRRRLLEMQKRLLAKKLEEERRKEGVEAIGGEVKARDVLKRIFVGRAEEVWDAACRQYPQVMRRLEEGLARLVLRGEIDETLDEGQLLFILRSIGLRPRFETKIRILEDGKLKTLSEKLREEHD
ncbi:MAG: DNA-binding protein [Candidatus Bathyarchaeia archaeon]